MSDKSRDTAVSGYKQSQFVESDTEDEDNIVDPDCDSEEPDSESESESESEPEPEPENENESDSDSESESDSDSDSSEGELFVNPNSGVENASGIENASDGSENFGTPGASGTVRASEESGAVGTSGTWRASANSDSGTWRASDESDKSGAFGASGTERASVHSGALDASDSGVLNASGSTLEYSKLGSGATSTGAFDIGNSSGISDSAIEELSQGIDQLNMGSMDYQFSENSTGEPDRAATSFLIPGTICNRSVHSLIDSGADASSISHSVVLNLGLTSAITNCTPALVKTATGETRSVSESVRLTIKTGSWSKSMIFYVVDGLSHDVILGLPSISQNFSLFSLIDWTTLTFADVPSGC